MSRTIRVRLEEVEMGVKQTRQPPLLVLLKSVAYGRRGRWWDVESQPEYAVELVGSLRAQLRSVCGLTAQP